MALLKANRFANDDDIFIPIGNEINRIFFIEITKRTKTFVSRTYPTKVYPYLINRQISLSS